MRSDTLQSVKIFTPYFVAIIASATVVAILHFFIVSQANYNASINRCVEAGQPAAECSIAMQK